MADREDFLYKRIRIRSVKKKLGALRVLIRCRFPVAKTLSALRRGTERKVLLIGTPLHTNLGDHLLALSELELLKQAFGDYLILELPTCFYLAFKKTIVESLTPDDEVFISGGGWMGDVWKRDELIMEDMVATFSKRSGVRVFPQTVFFEDRKSCFFAAAVSFWSQESNYLLSLRETRSYELCKDVLGISDNNLFLLPDAGLLYRPHFEVFEETEIPKVLFCLREDVEATVNNVDQECLVCKIKELGFEVTETSTLTDSDFFYFERKRIVERKIDVFRQASLVVTNRLHGMIFSFLAGTPCIALNNLTQKVKGVYDTWLSDCSGVIYLEDAKTLFDELEKHKHLNSLLNYIGRPNPFAYQEKWTQLYEKAREEKLWQIKLNG